MIHNRGFGVRELAFTAALALSLGGCEQKTVEQPAPPGPPPAANTPTAAPEPDAVYVVRGRVVELPSSTNPTKEFRVHHEPIPTFKTPAGEVVGMREMIMPFPVSDPSLLEGVAVGDVVELTFADWYKPMRTYKVTKLVKLPADTSLELKDQ